MQPRLTVSDIYCSHFATAPFSPARFCGKRLMPRTRTDSAVALAVQAIESFLIEFLNYIFGSSDQAGSFI
jgi:hypothetical protein